MTAADHRQQLRYAGQERSESRNTPLWGAALTALLLVLGVGRRRPPAQRNTEWPALAEEGRGRHADSPAEIPVRGWKDILIRIYEKIFEDRILANAAGVTFYALLAIFPAIAALVSIYGLFSNPSVIARHLDNLSGFIPAGAIEIIADQMRRVSQSGDRTLGLVFVVSLLVSLWSANAGTKALFDALNVVYGEREKRSFLRFTAVTFTFTLGIMLFLLLVLAAAVFLPAVLSFIPLPRETKLLVSLLPWPVLLIAAGLVISLTYRYGPSRDTARVAWVSVGGVFATIAWLAVSALFSWYAANFGTFNETYGSLGAAMGFMFWIWISTIVILVGAELNAETEHQTSRDSTVGRPQPMGKRGAYVADTIGAARD